MTLYCAIDLHSNNNVPVVIDDSDKVLFQKRLSNRLPDILTALEPFKDKLHAVAVESTFNWYWLVDGLNENGYKTVLVNTTAVQQYSGIKHTNDFTDANWLAHLMRLGILPTGYIYPPKDRAVRDLLRKRLQLVQQRVRNILSAQNQLWRSTGINITSKPIRAADYEILNNLKDIHVQMAVKANLNVIALLNQEIDRIEKCVLKKSKLKPEFQALLTINGVGNILGQTIMLETGDISRFKSVGNFSSYARCVSSSRTSNNKKKGVNNKKNGNKYLAWAFVEAAHSIICYNKTAHRFYQKKRSQCNGALATKALAHKIARAAYYIMRDGVSFEIDKLFST
jgi:transposase